MRKSRKAAAETRERIVSVAAKEFKERGIERTGLADIMNSAGLTHGGFYKHFSSKDQLVAEALDRALDRSFRAMEGPRGDRSLEGLVNDYLSKRRRDDFDLACPLSSLGSELRFSDGAARKAASEGVDRFVSVVQARFPDLPANEAKAKARAIVAAMIGGMLLSRIVTDPKLSESFLKDTKKFIAQS